MRLGRRAFVGGAIALATVGCAGEGPAPIVGRRAPDFKLAALDGGELWLAGLKGQPVVVNFFATWCTPCKKELPAFQALAGQYAERGLTFLLVDMQEDPDDVAVFLGELRVSLPAVVDSSGEVGKTYRVRGLPSTFFVGRDGVIKQVQLGELDQRLLEAGISKIV
jgi:cytochrome c biogenesis protein CcmG, thiol:disulfide interchange protein DsbE